MNDTIAQLLAGVRAEPADDTPRLVLADAVQEQGFEMAAVYIRDDVAWSRSTTRARRPVRTHMAAGYAKWLLAVLGDPPDLRTNGGESWNEWVFTFGERRRGVVEIFRGLPYIVRVTAPAYMDLAPRLFQFPLVSCRLSDRSPQREQYDEVFYVWQRAHWPQKFNTWEEDAWQLPPVLFDRLAWPVSSHGLAARFYPNISSANSDLHAAALSYGRTLVAPTEPIRPS